MISIFNKKKQKQEELQYFGNSLQAALKNDIKQSFEEVIHSAMEKQTHTFAEDHDKLSKKLNKQNSMLEDILDTLEETNHEKEKSEKLLQTAEQQKEGLLSLILKYQEYLELLSGFMNESAGNPSVQDKDKLNSQLNLVFRDLAHERSLNGIEIINGAVGVSSGTAIKVNTNLHQVIKVEETDDPLLGETIKQVLVPGCIYQGNVIKKAKIIAFIYKGE